MEISKQTSSTDPAETRDFMNVDSFSQLPFIRPSPLKDRPPLRLFGIDVASAESDSANSTANEEAAAAPKDGDNGRRFECHYCCRNFPTSQALGGHQNAHKRERQHAKRAHLHSAVAQSSLSDAARIYGLVNYRIGSSAPPPTYPSWNRNSSNNNINSLSSSRFYGTSTSHGAGYSQQPINGSPLSVWRIPPAAPSGGGFGWERSSSSRPLTLLGGEELKAGQTTARASSQNRFVYEPRASVQDQVSLDLHL